MPTHLLQLFHKGIQFTPLKVPRHLATFYINNTFWILWMWHYLTVLSHSIVLAKGGSKLETTTAQLARKSSVRHKTLQVL
jgi:hypothetical protein